MTPLRFGPFSGIAPRIDPRYLPKHMGQNAENCRLFSGGLSSWKRPKQIVAATKATLGTVKSIFRMNNGGADFWLNWLTDVNCVRGPIAGDTSQRIYYTGDGEPRVSNFALATSGGDFPTQWFVLGVFAPTTAPTVGATGGSGAQVTRSFVYTFVTQFGEESQPSPPGTFTTFLNATSWDITNMQVAPANSFAVTGGSWSAGIATLNLASSFGLRVGEEISVTSVNPSGYNTAKAVLTDVQAGSIKYPLAADPGVWISGGTITRIAPHNTTSMKKRIYVTGDTGIGETDFQFWVEKNASDTGHSAAVTDSALGEVISSTDWAMPPVDMKGLIEHENGVLAGFSKNELCPCEPFRPHAWPTKYRQPTMRDIVGIGSFAKTIVVGTKAQPYISFGTHPENYTMEAVNLKQPCVSKRGVASFPFGVMYPSPDGLVLIGQGGALLASEVVVTKKEWAAFFPSTLHAQEFQGRYFAWFEESAGVTKGFIFDRSGQGPDLVPIAVPATASYTDPETGDLYVVDEGFIKQWDGDALNFLPYDWLSSIRVLPKPVNPGYAKVKAKYEQLDDDDAAQAQKASDTAFNATILDDAETHPGQGKTKGEWNGAMWNEMMWNGSLLIGGDFPVFDDRTLVFQLYALNEATNVMELKHTHYPVSEKVFALPPGYETTDVAIKIAGNIEATSCEIAETAEELAQV